MARLCERPGCSAPAAVAYGMDSEQLLVWLEVMPDDAGTPRMGVVCRRHADAMVVPRDWTLDDRRESRPRLFRVSESSATARAKPARRRRVASSGSEQLSLAMSCSTSGECDSDSGPMLDDGVTVGEIRPLHLPDANETQAIPWRFEFNERDELSSVLDAGSPLLSRAFRGQPLRG